MWSTNNTNSTNSSSVPQLSNCGHLFNLKIRHYKQSTPASLAISRSAVITIGLSYPFIVILNCFIVAAFYKKPAIRTRGNIHLGALAVTSLINGAICSPLFFAKEILYQLEVEPNCYLEILSSLSAIVPMTSVQQIALLNCERFLGFKFPVWHRNTVTKERLLKAAVCPWIISTIAITFKLFREEGNTLVYGIPIASLISTLVFAVLIWRAIAERNKVQADQDESQQRQPSATFTNAENKAAKLAICLGITLLFTRVLPAIIIYIYGVFDKNDSRNITDTSKSSTVYINAFLFPIIYGVMNSNIRRACLEMLKCQ